MLTDSNAATAYCATFARILSLHVLPSAVSAPSVQVPSIQQTAALALGRLANYSDDLAEAVVANDILPQLVDSLGEQNVRTGCFYLVRGCECVPVRSQGVTPG